MAKLVRYRGAPYGGSKITFSNPIDLATHSEITLKVWTSAPVGTSVTLKTEKPFWGVERTVQTTKSSGSGLGLFVVRTTMENHHGTLRWGLNDRGGASLNLLFPAKPGPDSMGQALPTSGD